MTWLVCTGVVVSAVLRKQVNVVEDEALPFTVPQSLDKAHVHKLSPIEGLIRDLFDHKYPVVKMLSLEERMNILKESAQVIISVPEIVEFHVFLTS